MMGVVPDLFYRFPRNVVAIFSGRNLLWHAAAIGLLQTCALNTTKWLRCRLQ
jgi:hypothetical protein